MYGNDDAFTKSAYDVMKAALAKLGIEVLTTETFGSKDTDFSAQLTKIKALNPDAIVVSALVEAGIGHLAGQEGARLSGKRARDRRQRPEFAQGRRDRRRCG